MASRKNARWELNYLRQRGWTPELAQALLPPAELQPRGKGQVRVWRRGDVEAAERTEAFRAAAKPQDSAADARQRGAERLAQAWTRTPLPEGRAALLAQHYHNAIMRQLRRSSGTAALRPGKAASYAAALLALERRGGGDCSGVLRRFAATGTWLGAAEPEPAVNRLLDRYGTALLALARQQLEQFQAAQPEADVDGLLQMARFPAGELLAHPLGYVYSVLYIPQAIRTSLTLLVALHPKDEYPAARAMERHFVLHLGGTNTGKTYAGFQRLKSARTGVYLSPLRLLALEAQETLLDAGVACSLSTGEEEDWQAGDTHVAATAEKLDVNRQYDVAVVDECQMIADPQRGYAWTRAILGLQAPEIHLCAAPHAQHILQKLIRDCGDSYEVVYHKRKTPLTCMKRTVDEHSLQPGDALITFSKIGVLSIAEELRQRGKTPAIIYGALPYATRRRQMEGFLAGQTEYIVATDAIGMGLNLPIRRIIFMDTEKFDGVERRELRPEEIQQIAGRAGRYGMYDRGYVGAVRDLEKIQAGLYAAVPPIEFAVTGFSDYVLSCAFDLLEVLEVWSRMPTPAPYRKLDVSRYLTLIRTLRERGFQLSREQELRAASIPFDETEPALLGQLCDQLKLWQAGENPPQPQPPDKPPELYTLPELELYCRELDLYFSFSKAFHCAVDHDALYDARQLAAEQINSILLHNLKNNIRFCALCGAALPLHHAGRICPACYRKRARQQQRPRWLGR